MTNHPNRATVLRRADQENGCETCWEQLVADCLAAGLPDPRKAGDFAYFRVPRKWAARICRHGPPQYAQGILLD